MLGNSSKVILLGYSGHGYVVADLANQLKQELLGYAEFKPVLKNPFEMVYLGDETKESFNWGQSNNYLLGVGNNKIRNKIAKRVEENKGHCLTLIHPDASISKVATIGDGTIICRNVAINALVKVGENVILNTSCSIDHECIINDNVHVAPGAVLAGNVSVGEFSFIGANSVIKEGVKIGENAVIGAGSVVIRDVPSNSKVVGNPAKELIK